MFIQKRLFYITNPTLRQILLGFQGFIIAFGWLSYWLATEKVLTGVLSLTQHDIPTQETFHFYIGNNLYTITASVFSGKIWYEDMPDSAIAEALANFGIEGYNDTLASFRRELKILNAEQQEYRQKIYDLTSRKQRIEDELTRKRAEIQLADDEETKQIVESEFLEMKQTKGEEIEQLQLDIATNVKMLNDLIKQIEKIGKEAQKLIEQRYKKKDFEKTELEFLLFGKEKLESYRTRLADEQTRSATLQKALENQQRVADQLTTTISENVSMQVAALNNSSIAYALAPGEEGAIGADGQPIAKKRRLKSLDMGTAASLFGKVTLAIAWLALFAKIIDKIIELAGAFSSMTTAQFVLTIIVLLSIVAFSFYALSWITQNLLGAQKLQLQ